MFWKINYELLAVAGAGLGRNGDQGSRILRIRRGAAAFMNDESAQDLVEYVLMAALVALVGLASFTSFSGGVTSKIINEFNTVGSDM